MKKLFQKLNSCRGESIGEVLVALLISALALVMLAGMISASSRMITKSKTELKEYYDANAALNSESSSGIDGAVSLKTSGGTNTSVKLVPGAEQISVQYFVNSKDGRVVSYKKK